jgi:hypothetical protein
MGRLTFLLVALFLLLFGVFSTQWLNRPGQNPAAGLQSGSQALQANADKAQQLARQAKTVAAPALADAQTQAAQAAEALKQKATTAATTAAKNASGKASELLSENTDALREALMNKASQGKETAVNALKKSTQVVPSSMDQFKESMKSKMQESALESNLEKAGQNAPVAPSIQPAAPVAKATVKSMPVTASKPVSTPPLQKPVVTASLPAGMNGVLTNKMLKANSNASVMKVQVTDNSFAPAFAKGSVVTLKRSTTIHPNKKYVMNMKPGWAKVALNYVTPDGKAMKALNHNRPDVPTKLYRGQQQWEIVGVQ